MRITVKVERWDHLYRTEDRIHASSCRFVNPGSDEWVYWINEGVWKYEDLQELIAKDAPWLKACKVCKPTGWVEAREPA